ncbi:hypothetical protein K2173_022133 [Erythroxylum novogranatense]|uniref:Uncharacterized protein n=1 Tax=Erythroxylum novogranatense TaxID=1862640 RepID=A0AAV8SU64_9ROSI|nr:hypothetical protein K2173_022133 [Erythroxylum novogranatense]
MVEFLMLMVALDKIWFTPLGKFMDERDVAIREKLSNVKDTSKEVKQLEEQLAAVMRAARAEIGFQFLFPNQLGLHLKFSSITLILIKWICPIRPVAIFGGFPNITYDAPDDLEGLDASAAHVANLLSTEPDYSK